MKKMFDSIIIWGGVMGLFSAYHLATEWKKILIVDKNSLDLSNKKAASFWYSRTYRDDYLDPLYNELSREAYTLWLALEKEVWEELLLKNGCVNLWNKVDWKWEDSYSCKSLATEWNSCILVDQWFFKEIPFTFDKWSFTSQGGICLLEKIRKFLINKLISLWVTFLQNSEIISIQELWSHCDIKINDGTTFIAGNIIICPGAGILEILSKLIGNTWFPVISPTRPMECQYFYPRNEPETLFALKTPIFACLDRGIYAHPAFNEKWAIKVWYYKPPGISLINETGIEGFIADYLPLLKTWRSEPVTDVDQCDYLMTIDEDFILWFIPWYKNISVITGCNGTGYKFSPLFWKYIANLCLGKTDDRFERFSPNRFSN